MISRKILRLTVGPPSSSWHGILKTGNISSAARQQVFQLASAFSTSCQHCSSNRIDNSSDSTVDSTLADPRDAEVVENPQGPIVPVGEPQRRATPVKRRGFAAAFEKFRGLKELKPQENTTIKEEKDETFAKILRNSKLIQLGFPEGKIVVGRIFHIIDDDLYVDFGGKFHAVCKRPQEEEEEVYYRGGFVRIRLASFELSTRFLGADRDLTLREADAVLVGPMKLPGTRPERRRGDSLRLSQTVLPESGKTRGV